MFSDFFWRSEFPSLSGGGPQMQNQNAVPQAWNSNAVRQSATPQQGSIQRPPGHAGPTQREPSGQQQPPIQQQQQQPLPPPQSHQEDSFRFGAPVEAQFDGRGSATQRSETNSSQLGVTDDFPPLGGGMNGDTRHDRQGGMMQAGGFGSGPGGNAFGLGQVNGQSEGGAALIAGASDGEIYFRCRKRNPADAQTSFALTLRSAPRPKYHPRRTTITASRQQQLGLETDGHWSTECRPTGAARYRFWHADGRESRSDATTATTAAATAAFRHGRQR